jgi:hypothetical protein
MRPLLVLLTAVIAASPVEAVADRPPKKKPLVQQTDDKLQGTWVLVSIEYNGKKILAGMIP